MLSWHLLVLNNRLKFYSIPLKKEFTNFPKEFNKNSLTNPQHKPLKPNPLTPNPKKTP